MTSYVLLGFALAVMPLVMTPGVSSTLVVARTVGGGRAAAVKVALGTATGLYVHATAAAIGLAALVMASSLAFMALKIVGAVYLVWLGITMFRNAGRSTPTELPWTGRSAYAQALLGNVLNPKASAVYLTLMPQFIDPTASVVPQIYALATVHAAVAVAYLGLLAQLVAVFGAVLGKPHWRSLMQRASGAVVLGLGLRAAVASRL